MDETAGTLMSSNFKQIHTPPKVAILCQEESYRAYSDSLKGVFRLSAKPKAKYIRSEVGKLPLNDGVV